MKNTLTHLPKEKQEQLQAATDMIRAKMNPEMIILFGSYARGNWVEDYQEKYEYVSDFDVLVITKDRKSAKRSKQWHELEKELQGGEGLPKTNIIYHSIGFVNDKIEKNSYFFTDILKEGVLLYDSGNFKLAQPRELKPEERKAKAQEEFEHWFEGANRFLETAIIQVEKEWYKEAAFNLHQATERYYAAVLLVFTDYKPNTHDLEDLGQQVANLNPAFYTVFPTTTDEEKRLFELLRRAYVDARYTKASPSRKKNWIT